MSEVVPRPRYSGPAFNGGMGRAIVFVEGLENHAEREGGVVFLKLLSRAHSQMIIDQLAFRSRTSFAAFVKKIKMRLSLRYTRCAVKGMHRSIRIFNVAKSGGYSRRVSCAFRRIFFMNLLIEAETGLNLRHSPPGFPDLVEKIFLSSIRTWRP